jgi:hypothetical protein
MANYVETANRVLAERRMRQQSREWVLKGHAVELWWRGESLWLVADEQDARLLGEPRGSVYTTEEVEYLATIRDPVIVFEIHAWKKAMGAEILEIE